MASTETSGGRFSKALRALSLLLGCCPLVPNKKAFSFALSLPLSVCMPQASSFLLRLCGCCTRNTRVDTLGLLVQLMRGRCL